MSFALTSRALVASPVTSRVTPARAPRRAARAAPRAGPFAANGDANAENKKQQATKASNARASPPGVPPPPIVPVIEPATFGFVENAERQNSRASMIGWWSLLLVEAVAGKGLLEIAGFEVGKGINFTF